MLGRMRTLVARRDPRSSTGASVVEYGIIVSLIAAVIVTVVFLFGSATKSLFSTSNACLQSQGRTC